MSLHKSLKRKDTLTRRRNVLTRSERVERLKEEERWGEDPRSVFGLPKVKPHIVEVPSARARREDKAAEAEGEAQETPESSAAEE